jgi:hypothetical protein
MHEVFGWRVEPFSVTFSVLSGMKSQAYPGPL